MASEGIGQCVGAFNHKFFIIFSFWSSLWTLWIFATLIGLLAKDENNVDADPQFIVLVALYAFYTCSHDLPH